MPITPTPQNYTGTGAVAPTTPPPATPSPVPPVTDTPAEQPDQSTIHDSFPVVEGMHLFKDEAAMYQKMKADNVSDDQARQMLKQRRQDLSGGMPLVSQDEAQMLLKMQQAGETSKDAFQMIQDRRNDTEKLNPDFSNLPAVGLKNMADTIPYASTPEALQRTPNEPWWQTVLKTAGNLPIDAYNVAASLGNLGITGVQEAVGVKPRGSTGGAIVGALANMAQGGIGALEQAKTAAQQKGTVAGLQSLSESALKSAEEHPAMLATSLEPKGAAEAVQALGEKAVDTAKAFPDVIGKTADAAKEAAKFTLSQLSGLNRDTLDTAVSNTKLPEYMNMGEENARAGLTQSVLNALDERKQELSEGGKLYEQARQATTELSPEDVLGHIEDNLSPDAKKVVDTGKTAGTSLTAAEGKQILSALNEVKGNLDESNGVITGQTLHDIRMKLDKFIDWNDPSMRTANGIIKDIRGSVDNLAKQNVPGLKTLDATYGPERQFIDQLQKDLLNKDGTPKDRIESVLSNLTNKGQEGKLARMEKLLPGVTDDVKALKALSDLNATKGIKVGTYTKSILAGAAGFGAGGPIGALAAMVATHPSVVLSALQRFGNLSRWIAEKMGRGEKLTANENISASEAFQKAAQEMSKQQTLPTSQKSLPVSAPTVIPASPIKSFLASLDKPAEFSLQDAPAKLAEEVRTGSMNAHEAAQAFQELEQKALDNAKANGVDFLHQTAMKALKAHKDFQEKLGASVETLAGQRTSSHVSGIFGDMGSKPAQISHIGKIFQ